MMAANIEWDCTNEEREFLPSRVILPGPEDKWLNDPDEVTEYLSDEYGFCLCTGPLLLTQNEIDSMYSRILEEPLQEYGVSAGEVTYEDAVDILCNIAEGLDEGNCINAQLQALTNTHGQAREVV